VGTPYIDIKGDGVFALFNSNQVNKALASAILFKTFIQEEFSPRIKSKHDLDIGSHCGIDQKTLLVKRFGLKRAGLRTDRQNEVWAGKPVNMAAKLASLSEKNEILVSKRFWKNINHENLLKSCGCPNGVTDLWKSFQTNSDKFDFDTYYKLESNWCKDHGKDYCNEVLNS
jgi:class 3 adenylate cyclase